MKNILKSIGISLLLSLIPLLLKRKKSSSMVRGKR